MIRLILNLYIIIVIVDAILSYLPQVRHHGWARKIKRVADFTLKPIRRYLPKDLPFDVSPVILIVSLKLIEALW